MKTALSHSLALALGALLTVSACGSGSDTAAEPEETLDPAVESAIVEVIEGVFISTSPDDCTVFLTDNALAQRATGDDDPLTTCEERAASTQPADSVAVTDLVLDGRAATAVGTPDGGDNAGLSFTVALVDDAGWKIDELTSVEVVDREAVNELLDDFDELTNVVPEKDARCILDGVFAVDDELIEDLALTGSLEYLALPVRDCLGDGDETAALANLTTTWLIDEGYDEPLSRCLGDGSAQAMTDVPIVDLLLGGQDELDAWQKAIFDAAPGCQ